MFYKRLKEGEGQMKNRKVLFTILTLLVGMSMLLAACKKAEETPAATTEAPPAAATQPPAETEPPEEMAGIDCMGTSPGDQLTVMYQWSGAEEEKINAIFAPFIDACGIEIVAESTRDEAVLDTRVKSQPPDLLFWPTTAPLSLYTDLLQDLEALGASSENYADYWIDLGSVDGTWLMAPIKADIKTLIWYSPVQFDAWGYSVPTTFEELDALVEQMVADGNVPWSMGFGSDAATGWTGSDFIQDLLLVQQGPDYVNGLLDGSIPYDDAGVVQAYETYVMWASDETYTVGGATGTVNTPFLDAIYKIASDPPEAMMVKQSGFAGGEIVAQFPDLEYGVDFDFFAFPGAQGMQGGADNMFAFGSSEATKAMLGYLTGPEGARIWAETGFDLSPNNLATGHYTDAQLSKKADALASATGFTPDMGDAIGAPFGSAEWKAIIDTVMGEDIPTALAAAAAAQAEALGGAPVEEAPPEEMAGIDCMDTSPGDQLTVMYQWSGAEEEKINAIFAPFIDACGIEIVAESTRDEAVLDTRVKSQPPDLLFWPTTAPLSLYTDLLQDLEALGASSENYADYWIDLGSVDGTWLMAPIKADIKTLIWYSPVQFDAWGYSVPTTFEELDALVEQMVADGNVPWSMGFGSDAATGWTGSDFIQDLLLVQQGPDYVNGLLDGSIPYDDAGVVQAYETYVMWASDETYTVGGATGTVNTPFLDAIYKIASDPPEAMMVKQSGFAGGEIVAQFPDLEYGVDFDFFAFPGAQGMQGGADNMFAFGSSEATKAMLGYLTGPEGARIWAETGFDLSPNNLATGHYTDAQLSKKADALASATGFTPDMGDAIGAPFGSAEWKAIIDAVMGEDIPTALAAAAAAQAEALGQ
jgi:alpha-glucoside transport system substrate-binding protein